MGGRSFPSLGSTKLAQNLGIRYKSFGITSIDRWEPFGIEPTTSSLRMMQSPISSACIINYLSRQNSKINPFNWNVNGTCGTARLCLRALRIGTPNQISIATLQRESLNGTSNRKDLSCRPPGAPKETKYMLGCLNCFASVAVR
jgi:hypothetical protein